MRKLFTSVLACLLLASCASAPAPTRIALATSQLQSDVPHLHVPRAGLVTGGQPDATAWRDLHAAGVTRVINLRPASELGSRNEAGEVQASGMDYVQIDVAGAGDLTADNARLLWQSLQAGSGTVLVHCASGNRAGALLALAAQHSGMSPEAALEFGKAAGLTKLEPVVRERLGLPSLASEPSRCRASAPNC
ncbi:sulfur transferase domain-containing protein [Thermomonas sp.]|uniref:beta-lactamase hydrolase domain-containing protein n=1 Tax=Thermomonas sp. TaxID=1971895 RepID=UPI0024884B0D|nr:sulfur transferase domain-containing protein [Thermomonas sp.]MDI1251784.1 sulfur transferase domain-containing protein [Thermomonas sp.]